MNHALCFSCVLAGALALTACQLAPPRDAASSSCAAERRGAQPAVETSADTAGAVTRYRCADGHVVKARYPTVGRAHIVYQDRSIDMKLAVSASGARYTGGGWQWWTKGMTEGYLAPLQAGEEIASAAGMACTAK